MQKSNLPTKKVIALALMAMTLVSSSVFANVYKWRDARGRTQYSDTPPPTSYSIVKGSELVNALQSKDVCTVSSVKPKLIAQSKLRNLSANFDLKVLGIGSYSGPSALAKINQVSPFDTIGSFAKTTATIASITKYVASNAVPTIISPAAASPVVKPVSPPAVSSTPTPVATSPAAVAINLPPNIVQVALMPAVDISKNVTPAIGYSDFRIKPTTEIAPIQGGAFRINCTISHMANDDPMVYPNQPGASHHHTFFGNTSINAKSDLMTLSSTGNSTCNGGIMNRSAYWVPSMIDTSSNTPIKPDGILFYYKTGDFGAMPTVTITPPPKGLRMIAGNSKATTAAAAVGLYTCVTATGTTPWQPNIVNCAVGDTMQLHIDFPQCWDGVNLDSPDHKSHMSYRVNSPGVPAACPATHPVMIPAITLNLNYKITVANQTNKWRLASDNYASTLPGGYSTHADWVNGWDEQTMAGIVKNCLQKNADGHAHLLCDGRTFY